MFYSSSILYYRDQCSGFCLLQTHSACKAKIFKELIINVNIQSEVKGRHINLLKTL